MLTGYDTDQQQCSEEALDEGSHELSLDCTQGTNINAKLSNDTLYDYAVKGSWIPCMNAARP